LDRLLRAHLAAKTPVMSSSGNAVLDRLLGVGHVQACNQNEARQPTTKPINH
jgi:hypothetical protein